MSVRGPIPTREGPTALRPEHVGGQINYSGGNLAGAVSWKDVGSNLAPAKFFSSEISLRVNAFFSTG